MADIRCKLKIVSGFKERGSPHARRKSGIDPKVFEELRKFHEQGGEIPKGQFEGKKKPKKKPKAKRKS